VDETERRSRIGATVRRLCELVDEDERLNRLVTTSVQPTEDLSRDGTLFFADACAVLAERVTRQLRSQRPVSEVRPPGQYL
jgi:hypothetical protein